MYNKISQPVVIIFIFGDIIERDKEEFSAKTVRYFNWKPTFFARLYGLTGQGMFIGEVETVGFLDDWDRVMFVAKHLVEGFEASFSCWIFGATCRDVLVGLRIGDVKKAVIGRRRTESAVGEVESVTEIETMVNMKIALFFALPSKSLTCFQMWSYFSPE